MKRKLLLLIGSFIILLLAFGTYQLFVPGIAMFDPTGETRRRPPELDSDLAEGQGLLGKSKGITFFYRNPEGQLRGVYKVAAWNKEDDGSLTLEKPEAVIYQRDGTRAYVSADRGRIWAEEVAGGSGFNVRHGRLDGDVEIFYDQSTDDKYGGAERDHPKDRPYEDMIQDVIRIRTRDVTFNRDMLELVTDQEVTVWSRQFDMNGQGLKIQWNEDPRELRLLRIGQGRILVVKELPEQVDLTQLPTPAATQPAEPASEASSATSPALAAAAPESQPTSRPDAESQPAVAHQGKEKLDMDALAAQWGLEGDKAAATQPTSAAALAPNEDEEKDEADRPEDEQPKDAGVKLGLAPTDVSTTMPAGLLPGQTPEQRNIYQAAFLKDVRIHSGDRRLIGADQLTMTFEWDRAWRPDMGEKAPAVAAASQPASQPSSQPSSQPKDGADPKFASPKVSVLETRIDEDQAKADKNQMVIYWDGPLEITPKGRTPEPSRKRYTIAGEGKQIFLNDADARIVCKRFEFRNPQQEAWFEGDDESPARVQLARGDELFCQGRIRFNRSLGKAFLEGPGYLVRYAKDPDFSDWDAIPIDQGEYRLVADFLTWADHAEAGFGEREITADGKKQTRPYIQDATFFKDAEMAQLVEPTPRKRRAKVQSYVRANDQLRVEMGLTDEGKSYPLRAYGKGKVSALQQGSRVMAEEATVEFRPVMKPPASQSAPASAPKPERPAGRPLDLDSWLGGATVEASAMQASGDVDITYRDPKHPEEDPLRIQADMIDADLTRNLAVLTGQPAKIWQGPNRIEGEIINFDENAEAAKITGTGKLEFNTRQDLSGNRLAASRPVSVTWSNWMVYHGQSGQGVFDGDVDLKSSGEAIQCRQLRLFFRPRSESPSGRGEGGIPRGSRSLAMGIDNFSRPDFTRMEADGGKGQEKFVTLCSTRRHEKNPEWIERRMEVRGEQVIYDATTGNAYVNGGGTFMAEDYRPPDKQPSKPVNEAVFDPQITRPNQTLLEWSRAMSISQSAGHAKAEGAVKMVHYSGEKILRIPGVKTAPLRGLPDGETAKIRAGVIDLWFEEAPPVVEARDESGRIVPRDAAKKPSPDLLEAGPQFGSLRRLNAEEDVTFERNEAKLDAYRILYDRGRGLLEAYGYKEGSSKRTDAQITIEDPRAGVAPKTYRYPELIYDINSGMVKVERIGGGG